MSVCVFQAMIEIVNYSENRKDPGAQTQQRESPALDFLCLVNLLPTPFHFSIFPIFLGTCKIKFHLQGRQ